MKIIFTFILGFLLQTAVVAEDSIDEMLSQAKKISEDRLDAGDQSSVVRLLSAILERDPGHPEALWVLVFSENIKSISNRTSLSRRAIVLASVAPQIQAISNAANARGETGFAHYVLARYAALYNNYSRALKEIDLALKDQPDHVKYLWNKSKLLISQGQRQKNDSLIRTGMNLLTEIENNYEHDDSYQFDSSDYYFEMAFANETMQELDDQETIRYYLAAIDLNQGKGLTLAHAWNNVSNIYRRRGQCQKAKEAAENALKISDFGMARKNLAYAKFCLEISVNSTDSTVKSF